MDCLHGKFQVCDSRKTSLGYDMGRSHLGGYIKTIIHGLSLSFSPPSSAKILLTVLDVDNRVGGPPM